MFLRIQGNGGLFNHQIGAKTYLRPHEEVYLVLNVQWQAFFCDFF
jgi:hypothetical protein